MKNYNSTRSRLYTMDYRMRGEKYKIGPAARKNARNNKNGECTENTEIAAHCARTQTPDIPA